MKVTILREAEIRQCVGLDREAIAAVADGFTRLAQGGAVIPPIMAINIPGNGGEADIKTAYLHGLDLFAVKMASWFPGNQDLGLPTGSGLMVVLSARTGFLEALLLDNGYLTDVRTAAAGAVAAQHLARPRIETVGVIGTGVQARYQVRALQQVRGFARVLVHGRSPARVQRYVAEMAPALGVEVVAAGSAEEVVRTSDVLVTATAARAPLVRAEWLHPGLHITAMGSDGEGKQELYPEVLGRADLLVCDLKAQCFRIGELQHGLKAGLIAEEGPILELGELTSGRHPGRTGDEQITVCDLTGVGVQDTAIALLAYRRAREKGLGLEIEV